MLEELTTLPAKCSVWFDLDGKKLLAERADFDDLCQSRGVTSSAQRMRGIGFCV